MLTKPQIEIHHELYRAYGGAFCDPKYSPAHKQQQHLDILKRWCRENWHRRPDFPSWVEEWAKKWVSEKKTTAGVGQ